jgi:hypothetical protein
MIAVIRYPRKMRISTRIAVTDKMSAAYVSPFIQIYLFIRTYMSALVDMMQDYKKMSTVKCVVQEPRNRPGCRKHPVASGNE